MVFLKDNKDFLRLYRRARFSCAPYLVTYLMKNRQDESRIGIVTSKKIGKANKRNRAKRIIKAAYFELCQNYPSGYDIVFVARGKTPYLKTGDIVPVMQKQLDFLFSKIKR